MPQEKILIKFEPSGDKKLIQALNNLALAQKKVTGGTSGSTQAAKKFSSVAAGLTAKLKVQNITWKQLGVSSEVLKKAYQGNRIALEKLKIAMAGSNAQSLLGVRNNRLLANSFATLRSQLLLVSFGAMLIERAFVSLGEAHGRQEAANEKLRVGLGNVQDTTEGVTQRLVDYSAALQQTTAFGDEMITTGMVQFTTFGLNEKAIKALTPQVLNVARAIQTTSGSMPDLNSLFIAFGKATTTGIGTLTRYGVVLTETERAQLKNMDANESAVEIAEILKRQYGGLAEAYAKTTSGMLEAAALARGDAAEALGEVLAPAVLKVSNGLKLMFEAMSPERITRFGTATGVAALSVGLLSGNLWKAVKAIRAFNIAQAKTGWGLLAVGIGAAGFAAMEYFDIFDDGVNTLTDAEKRQLDLIESTKALKEVQEAGSLSLHKELQLLEAKTELERRIIQLGHEASPLEKILLTNIILKTEAIEKENQKKREQQKEQDKLNRLLENEKKIRLSVLESAVKYGIESKNAGKAAEAAARGVIEKWIQKAVAVQFEKALEFIPLPPPFNLAVAAAMAAGVSGAASSLLSEITIAEKGGLIGGRRHSQGGTMINAEQGEFIMSRSAVQSVGIENLNRMNEGGGGGAVTVNVSGNVLSQDFVEGELAENIMEAIRRGTDFGIS